MLSGLSESGCSGVGALSEVTSLSAIAITERFWGLVRVSRLAQLTLKLTQRGFWA